MYKVVFLGKDKAINARFMTARIRTDHENSYATSLTD